jgi:hypothetical protein
MSKNYKQKLNTQLYRLQTSKPFQLHFIHYGISDIGSNFNDCLYMPLVSEGLFDQQRP